MESTISYIVIILLIIISIYTYNKRKTRINIFSLSIQKYPQIILNIKINKYKGKITDIILEQNSNNNITIVNTKVELISKKREFNYYELTNISNTAVPYTLKAGESRSTSIPLESFKSLLMDGEHPFRTFRFMITDASGKNYKSHELGFDKKWIIYKPDSGHYN